MVMVKIICEKCNSSKVIIDYEYLSLFCCLNCNSLVDGKAVGKNLTRISDRKLIRLFIKYRDKFLYAYEYKLKKSHKLCVITEMYEQELVRRKDEYYAEK